MLQKLIVVYNPRSSKQAAIEREVLAPARKLTGWLVGKYVVTTESLAENAEKLAKILNDGDLVIVAGGDGTANMTVNAILQSKKDITFGVLGYGNFNDMARMLKTKRAVEYGGEYIGGVTEIVNRLAAGKVHEAFPLEVLVDGKHWRYALCYVTLGLFAESTRVFEEETVRKKLQTGKKHLMFSIWQLAKWYFRNRKREFLPVGRREEKGGPEIMIEGDGKLAQSLGGKVTDYIAVNGPRMARVMRGGKYYLREQEFRATTAKLGNFGSLMWFMLRSIFWRVPGKRVQDEILQFDEKGNVMIQAEGEAAKLEGVKKIEVRKAKCGIKVV